MLPKDGYTAMFRRMIDHPNIKIMLNTDFKEICTLNEEGTTLFGAPFEGEVIYTGQVDELFDFCYGELPYRSVEMVFETLRTEKYQEAATVNYPNQYDFTRITEFKHIHPVQSDHTTILKEYPQPHMQGKTTPYYPVFTEENQKSFAKYRKKAEKIENLTLAGRLAEYKYYDMDDAVENALQIFERLKVK
jgi:UDP-galactopyranose mutase